MVRNYREGALGLALNANALDPLWVYVYSWTGGVKAQSTKEDLQAD